MGIEEKERCERELFNRITDEITKQDNNVHSKLKEHISKQKMKPADKTINAFIVITNKNLAKLNKMLQNMNVQYRKELESTRRY